MFISETCFNKFFIEYDIFDGPCVRALISTGLGYGITLGAMLVKLPQILKIVAASSGEGISVIGTSLELAAAIITTAYNFLQGYAFSAYGDSFFITLQNTVIASLVFLYGTGAAPAVLYMAASSGLAVALCTGMLPLSALWYFQALNVPMVFVGKMIQAVSNYKAGSTGQLSVLTVALLFLGSASRIFTSIQDTGDQVLITQYVVSTLANAVLLSQIFYYWDTSEKKKKDKKKAKKA